MTFTKYLKDEREPKFSFSNHEHKVDQRKATGSTSSQRLHEPPRVREEHGAGSPPLQENPETQERHSPREENLPHASKTAALPLCCAKELFNQEDLEPRPTTMSR